MQGSAGERYPLYTYVFLLDYIATAKKLPQASRRGVGWHAGSSDYSSTLPDCGATAKTKIASKEDT